METILRYSGKYMNHMGHFDLCQDDPNLRYNFVQVGTHDNPDAMVMFFGFCLPAECNPNDTRALMNTLIERLKIPQLEVTHVVNDFTDPYEYGWLFYLTALLLTIILFLFLAATCFSK